MWDLRYYSGEKNRLWSSGSEAVYCGSCLNMFHDSESNSPLVICVCPLVWSSNTPTQTTGKIVGLHTGTYIFTVLYMTLIHNIEFHYIKAYKDILFTILKNIIIKYYNLIIRQAAWKYIDYIRSRSRVSSVSIVSDYELDDRAIGVRSPAGAKDCSSSLFVQTGSGAHPASCPMGTPRG
jgi:hypothetical protein